MKKLSLALTAFFFLQFSTSALADADLATGLDALGAHDYNTAIANLQPLGNDGNAEAAFRMCGMYYLGQGVPKNDSEAARFCHIAAEKGHVEAMYNLAVMYQKGEGIGQDFNESVRWYTAAAARGHTDARYNLKQIQVASTPQSQKQNLDLVHNAATNMSNIRSNAKPARAAAVNQPPVVDVAPNQPQATTLFPAPAPQQAPAPAVADAQPILNAQPLQKPAAIKAAAKSPAKTILPPPTPPVLPQPPMPPDFQPEIEKENEAVLTLPPPRPQLQQEPIQPAPVVAVVTHPLPAELHLQAAPKPIADAPRPPAQQFFRPPVAPVAPTSPKPVAVKEKEKPKTKTEAKAKPHPIKPEPPKQVATEKSPVSPEESKYCLIAAQRGNPDPKCEREFSSLLVKEKTPEPIKKPEPQKKLETLSIPQKPVAEDVTITTHPVPQADEIITPIPTTPVIAAAPPAANLQPNLAMAEATAYLVANTPAIPIPQIEKPVAITPPKPQHALQWYINQANTGNAQAQNNLGVMYRRALNGAPKDLPEAIRWFERAASQGSVNGMLNLASIYKAGEGTNQNLELAYAWYNMAAGRLPRGNAKKNRAQENVQQISQYLTNEQIGDALQYVTELDEHIPIMNEPIELDEEPKTVADSKS